MQLYINVNRFWDYPKSKPKNILAPSPIRNEINATLRLIPAISKKRGKILSDLTIEM